MKKLFACIALSLVLLLGADPLPIDTIVQTALEEWKVPGCAIAIVRDGRVIHAKGYGLKAVGTTDPVDAETLFAIGSCTKAFTAAAIALLVDGKKLSWDDPVVRYIPYFPSTEATLRDLLCHRSGYEKHDLVWYGSCQNRDEILFRLKDATPSYPLRTQFCYNNLMYLAAGQIIPVVTSMSWDAFLRDRIFIPLEMFATCTSMAELEKCSNRATPHALFNGEVRTIPWRNIDNIGPAGSISSNVLDMTHWIQFQLSRKKSLLTLSLIDEMHSPQISLAPHLDLHFYIPRGHALSYGLGWRLCDDRGLKMVEHVGAVDGMGSIVSLIPEKNLGIVILTNSEKSPLLFSLKNALFDLLLEDGHQDWNAYYKMAAEKIKKQEEAAIKQLVQERLGCGILRYPEPHSFTGVYESPLYGSFIFTLSPDGKKLLFQFAAFEGELRHLQAETFEVSSQQFPLAQYKSYITFSESDGKKMATFFSPGIVDAPFFKIK